jgi:peptidoglycan hydrolase-like protein with peptidoglycan-binding domain
MRKQLSRLTQAGLVLAALATGAMIVPVAAAQTAGSPPKSNGSSTHSTSSKSGKKSAKKLRRTKRVKGQAAPTADRISDIQEALAKRGAFDGTPTGKWDDSTVDAMRKFQTANHLNPTGKLDAPTLQKLGLGSETAGVAAPTPPPNSSANRLLSRNAQRDPEPADNN